VWNYTPIEIHRIGIALAQECSDLRILTFFVNIEHRYLQHGSTSRIDKVFTFIAYAVSNSSVSNIVLNVLASLAERRSAKKIVLSRLKWRKRFVTKKTARFLAAMHRAMGWLTHGYLIY